MPDMTRNELMGFMADIAGGIAGAVTVLAEMFKLGAPPAHFHILKEFDIKGSKLWLLYKDVCLTETPVLIAFLEACRQGVVTKEDVDGYLDTLMGTRDVGVATAMRKDLVYPAAQLSVAQMEASGTDG